jgi:glutamate racemase
VFCNALPESDHGYNRMPTAQRKAKVFSDALSGMVRAYHPDALLIACNTLSVVYPETDFACSTSVPVLGIVDIGVAMLHERLSLRPNCCAIIFGTETTIGADAHRSRLIASGIAARRLVPQACPDLAGEIESDAHGESASAAIELFTEDAVRRLPADTDTVLAGLYCTHYGYCAEQFAAAVRTQTGKPVEIVDPTRHMGVLLFSDERADQYPHTRVTVEVVTRAIISPVEVHSIGSLLERISPQTAAALRHHEVKRDLFPFVAEEDDRSPCRSN